MSEKRRREPRNLAGVACFEIEEIGFGSWCPLPDGQGPSTQVHMTIRTKSFPYPLVMRFKSRDAINRVIDALLLHRDDVWPEDSPDDPRGIRK